jgi:CrcB protein
MTVWIGVALLGGLGACGRFLLDGAIAARAFPFGTLAVNVSGAFALGVLAGAGVSSDAYLLAGTATLGSYTTFSTWMFETHRLGEEGRLPFAALNVAGSLAVGFGAVELGQLIGGLL